MTHELTRENNETREWIQFRGAQSSVTHDATGVHFGTTTLKDRLVHEPRAVVDPSDPDPPEGAIARPVAEKLVSTNPLVAWGIACPEPGCAETFETPQALSGHLSVHSDNEDEDDEDEQSD